MIYAVIDTNVLVSAFITHNPEAATAKVEGRILQNQCLTKTIVCSMKCH